MVGNLAAELFTQRISFMVVLAGIILFLFGRQHLKLLSFPLIYLIFMIPIPSILMLKITFPMQMLAAEAATFSLQLLDIPVFQLQRVRHFCIQEYAVYSSVFLCTVSCSSSAISG